ncbi:MAG: hypothetical protein IKX53_00300 [Bacteroidales bacterium]|nr:hypothetical protein [Bacteroidales bacterium]
MKRFYFALLVLCALLAAAPAQAQLNLNTLKNKAKNAVKQEVNKQKQAATDDKTTDNATSNQTVYGNEKRAEQPAQAAQRPVGPPMPEMLTLKPAWLPGDETDMYMEEVMWKLRDTPFQETKKLADQLSAWMKWAQQINEEMENGTRPKDSDLRDELEKGMANWCYFYGKMEDLIGIIARVDLRLNSQGQWVFNDVYPYFLTGMNKSGVPISKVDGKGQPIENRGAKVSYLKEKRPFRFGDFPITSGPTYFQAENISADKIEVAERDMHMALNIALLFEGFPVQEFKGEEPGKGHVYVRENFDIAYHKALFYYEAVKEAIANNGSGTANKQPMPKAGGMHSSMKAKVLAIEKGISKDVVDVVITSDSWQIERNAAGQPIRRVIFGYSIVNTSNGKMANRVSWAEEHQGGGKYGDLHAYGNGMESFYVK